MQADVPSLVRLDVESLSKDFAGVHALAEVSLKVDRGEILGVIGPNGSGKTTLINVISGVIRASGGQVRMDGTVLTRLPSYRVARSGIGRTFQNIRLFRDMTVIENVETAASRSPRAKGFLRPRRISREALQMLELEHLADTIVGSLPYGLQRRVEIARAIASQPLFLLLDEPAAGLNEAESDQLLEQIRVLRTELGAGILLVDHDLRLIMRVSQRIHVLNEGRTLAEGAPEQIRHSPAVIEAYLGSERDSAHLQADAEGRGPHPAESPTDPPAAS
jgi:ABC-type branched-subunit amino acid transport system ATPase component